MLARRLRLEADPYPFGRWRTVKVTGADPGDGTFRITVKPRRNTRYRVRAAGTPAVSRRATAYVSPRLRLTFALSGSAVVARARLRAARGVRLAGRRLVTYLLRSGSRRLVRLGGGRLSGAGRASFRVRRVRTGAKDLVFTCVTGLRAMGRRDVLSRRCGAPVIRVRR